MRALAQSLGREFGPKGIHVAHAVIDGVIDIPRTKEWKVSDAPDAKLNADAVSFIFLYNCCVLNLWAIFLLVDLSVTSNGIMEGCVADVDLWIT